MNPRMCPKLSFRVLRSSNYFQKDRRTCDLVVVLEKQSWMDPQAAWSCATAWTWPQLSGVAEMPCLALSPSMWMDLMSKHKPIPVIYLFSLNPPLFQRLQLQGLCKIPSWRGQKTPAAPSLGVEGDTWTDSNPPSLPLGTPPFLQPSPLCSHSRMALGSSTNIFHILDKEVSTILRFLKYV